MKAYGEVRRSWKADVNECMENSKLDFYKQIEMLGMDELIHPILLFHDQGTVELQVWTDGALGGVVMVQNLADPVGSNKLS